MNGLMGCRGLRSIVDGGSRIILCCPLWNWVNLLLFIIIDFCYKLCQGYSISLVLFKICRNHRFLST
jgi:hypothetical protein